jgi:hypothetical protein
MGYQSKTYSLSDQVVEAIEAAKAGGLSPNQFLRRVIGIDESDNDNHTPEATVKKVKDWRANRTPLPKPKDRPKG